MSSSRTSSSRNGNSSQPSTPHTAISLTSPTTRYHPYGCAHEERALRQAIWRADPNDIDPRLRGTPPGNPVVLDLTRTPPRPQRPRVINRNATRGVVIDLTLSPQGQREAERLEAYLRTREMKQRIRGIIKVIQDKRREDFRILHEALKQVYSYTGPYLQGDGEKQAAAYLIRAGGLGAEFVNIFDSQAKWQWLQMRVDAL
ncbi:hypothetical protein DFH28DRAFT_1125038 [Melampsora americana]|nr:hypothetical protein DFH28DRAFT_1125038 [Melampsora americana]